MWLEGRLLFMDTGRCVWHGCVYYPLPARSWLANYMYACSHAFSASLQILLLIGRLSTSLLSADADIVQTQSNPI